MLGGSAEISTASAALFSVEFDLLHEVLGPQAAVEVLRALGEYTNRRFNPIGGFLRPSQQGSRSSRYSLTRASDKARQLVADFAQELKHEAIDRIQSIAMAKMGAATCLDIYIRAGVAEVSSAGRHRSDNRESPGKAGDCCNTPMRIRRQRAMKKYSIETAVGIFVVVGLICVGYMTVKLGKVSLFGDGDLPALCPVRLGLRTQGRQLGRNLWDPGGQCDKSGHRPGRDRWGSWE